MKIKLMSHAETLALQSPTDNFSCMALDYVKEFGENTATFILNINTDLRLLQIGDLYVPVSINEREFNNSYVCSPYTHYVSYAYDELIHIPNKILRSLVSKILIKPFDVILKRSSINKVVIVNNWLLSTNLYPKIDPAEIKSITEYLISKFPDHTIMFRSLQNKQHSDLIRAFTDNNYLSIPSRQVYLWDSKDILHHTKKQRRNLSRDDLLLDDPDFIIKKIIDPTSPLLNTAVSLYNKLYLEKYSYCNPQLTRDFFSICIKKNILDIYLLTDKVNETSGVVGLWQNSNTITAPILGYETEHPYGYLLYRVASALSYRKAREQNLLCHKSSGAPEFKQFRGCKPEIEYSYVYTRHLNRKARAPWRLLHVLLVHLAVPIMKKYKL